MAGMRTSFLALVAATLLILPSAASAADHDASGTAVSGDYVEARTAEVFTGGCIMGSEGEVSGREAIMAWRVGHGSVNGVSLDGLAVVAVVAADTSLGMQELGGAAPSVVKAALRVDQRATPAQRKALVTLARSLAPDVIQDVIDVKAVPIAFERDGAHVAVRAGEATLDVSTHMHHDPSCGALQWFTPLADTEHAQLGMTKTQAWSGSSLGAKWSQSDRRSSFFGTFSLGS